MITGNGKSVFSGVAIGKVFVYHKRQEQVQNTAPQDAAIELERFRKAKETAAEQLKALFEKTRREVGEQEAMILDVQLMMMDDGDYNDAIIHMIEEENVGAAYAVALAGKQFADFFAGMDDDYMKARAADVRDVSGRLVSVLSGEKTGVAEMTEPMIIVAEDLSPSETVQFDKSKILAFVTTQGSSNSHTAILARMMNIPSLVGTKLDLDDSLGGRTMIVDGISGCYYLDPDEATLAKMREKQAECLAEKQSLDSFKGKESITSGGRRVHIYANIGNAGDLAGVIENDAEGIGLFRSEFLYLGRNDFPTEGEQFEAYRAVVSVMNGKKVIIRTLDIGADKQAEYFGLDKEDNPAMGYRAIRICLNRTDIFKTQLRAIFRASAFGTVSIMFPMIISVAEVQRIKEIVREVKHELKNEHIAFGNVELGIMIETPAAVMVSDELAKEVEFFSVGTNDLTQYTLAIDRQNRALDDIYDPHHPAVLRMLRIIAENARKNGIWAGICGELASDLTLTETFLEMGYEELSVSPVFTLELRKKVRESQIQ